MKLFMSHTSPYARKVRVFVREIGFEREVVETPVDPHSQPTELITANPLSKVPVLLTDDGVAIHDSRVIIAYLASLVPPSDLYPNPNDPQRWSAMTLAAHCEAILDIAIAWRLEDTRQPGERSIYWQTRWQNQIARALDALPGRIEALPAYGDYARLLTVVALDYLDFRHGNMDWRRGRPALEALHADWSQRPSMIETRPVGVAAE